ncbi:unnamed protein product [Meganyctiphanes norvegica]|uniref:NACHT domain-containing protein n=1 Tax=Meganyctiphanes norvegica TaxID=48144 RepID=A0AAV2QZJ0_MEGNR
MAMSITEEDRLKLNNEKAIMDVGRNGLIIVTTVLLKGDSVLVKFNGLSNADKRKKFNESQRNHIISGLSLNDMDVSLLDAIIRTFGGLGSCHLSDLLKTLKNKRNDFVHEKHMLSLDKAGLRLRLTELKTLCKDILEELKNYCSAAEIPLIDHSISVMENQLSLLEKTINDDILENTQNLVKEAANVATVINSLINSTLNANTTLNASAQANTQAQTTLNDIKKASIEFQTLIETTLDRINEANTSLSANVNSNIKASIEFQSLADSILKTIQETKSESKKKKWNDSEVLASARSEIIDFLSTKCQVQTAEGFERGCKASPNEIMTEFLMLRIRNDNLYENECQDTDKIAYQSVLELKSRNGQYFDVILLTGHGGMGKTTLSKYIGWVFSTDPSKVKGLSEVDLLLYLECRNLGIKCFDDLLKLLFPETPKKFHMDFEEFKSFIRSKNILTIIDGYDEVHPGTEQAVSEIFQLRNKRFIITTRPRSLRNIRYLVPDDKESITMQLLGILPEHYEKFVSKLLCILVEDEEQRKKICKELVSQLRNMITKLGTFLNSPMILTNITHLKVEEPDKMKDFSNTTEVYEALRRLKIGKVLKRMVQGKVSADIDLERMISKFMEIYDKIAVKAFIDYQYELSEELVLELIGECQKHSIPHEQLMSTFFATHICHDGCLPVTAYKYFHLTEQEFSFAKYLGMLIEKVIMNESIQEDAKTLEMTSILKNNLIWKYLSGSITEHELNQDKHQISRFRNIILFLVGEIARLSQSKKIFKKLSDKLIGIGWYLTDNIEWSNIDYGEDYISYNSEAGFIHSKKDNNTQSTKVNVTSSQSDDDTHVNKDDVPHNIDDDGTHIKGDDKYDSNQAKLTSNIVIESDLYTDTESDTHSYTDISVEEENDEASKYGKEDIILRYLAESKMDRYMLRSVRSKLSTMRFWKISNGQSFSALNLVLESIIPEQIAISLDSDPYMFPDLHNTISKLIEIKEKIAIELFFNGHYTGQVSGTSNNWINQNLNVTEFLGRIDNEGVSDLPKNINTLHVGVDYTVLISLNEKLKDLKKLTVLGIRVELCPKMEVVSLPKLSYKTGVLYVTLVCEISDDYASWVAQAARQLCPDTRNLEFRGLFVQKTHLTGIGIEKVLETMYDHGMHIRGSVKIWTTVCISPNKQEELDQLAKNRGLGGLQVYDIHSLEGAIPKTMVNVRTDYNPIITDQGASYQQNDPITESLAQQPTDMKIDIGSQLAQPIKAKFVVVGYSNCGKSNLIEVFCQKEFQTDWTPTVYDVYDANITVDGICVQLVLMNLAPLDDYSSLRSKAYPGTDVFILAFSIVDPVSFQKIRTHWVPEIKQQCGTNVQIILVGTKKDRRNEPNTLAELTDSRLGTEQPIKPEEGRAMAKHIGAITYLECSSKTNDGVREVFEAATRAMLSVRNITKAAKKKKGKIPDACKPM